MNANQNYEGSCPGGFLFSQGQGHLEIDMSEREASFNVRIYIQIFLDFRVVLANQYLEKL